MNVRMYLNQSTKMEEEIPEDENIPEVRKIVKVIPAIRENL